MALEVKSLGKAYIHSRELFFEYGSEPVKLSVDANTDLEIKYFFRGAISVSPFRF